MKKDTNQTGHKPEPQGNHLAIFLLILPVAALIWGFKGGVVLPIDQSSFLINASQYIILSYIVMWFLSYHQERGKKNKNLYIASAITFFLWFFGGIIATAKINTVWDESPEKTYFMKVVDVYRSTGSVKSSSDSVCMVKVDQQIFNEDYVRIRFQECEVVTPHVDGLMMQVKEGYLGYPWMKDHSIVKDIEFYKKQMGITDVSQ